VLRFFPPDVPTGKLAKLKEEVFFRERVETKEASRTKILFIDDTILSVGANTRVTIDEHVFDPERNLRQVTVSMGLGTLRALVGKAFGPGSRFEVRTPTAVAGVRGSYFIVSVPSLDVTEIIVLEGEVAVRNILAAVAGEVAVRPNLLTRIELNTPPIPPTPVPAPVRDSALAETKVVEQPPRDPVPRGQEAVTVTARVAPPPAEVKGEVERGEAQKATKSEEVKSGLRPADPAAAPGARAELTAVQTVAPALSAVQQLTVPGGGAAAIVSPLAVQTEGVKGTVEQAIEQQTLSPSAQQSLGVPTGGKANIRLKFP
jgi:hypothetical protein